ncbi:MAG: metal-sensitive transcriptional regulator [Gammaproteobacteria bacterium]|nr:metal-sensitive transcriptional regulator [Gammaproteobacteria bacterium]
MLIDKNSTVKRLNRIEGQVRGIKKMIEEERYCIDVLQQMQAIKAALSKVEDAILKDHSNTCVASAIASGNKKEQQQKFGELVDFIARYKGS